jgi:hypothetical protein
VNLLYHELWTCGLCYLLSTLLYYEVWYVYRSYFRFQPLPVYFPHQTFVSDVSEIPISFSFPELPFSISFPIKNMKTVMVLVFTDRFRPFSSLLSGVPPDSVRCTRGLQAELFTFGNSQRRFAIIHRTVRCTTGLSGAPGESDSELASFGNPLRYNSPDMSGAHRTVQWASGATATSRATVDCNALNARLRA